MNELYLTFSKDFLEKENEHLVAPPNPALELTKSTQEENNEEVKKVEESEEKPRNEMVDTVAAKEVTK